MKNEELVKLSFNYPEGQSRAVRVFVPEHEDGETLPVIYMTDGQNLFDEESSSFGSWHTREAVAAERQISGKAAIIVGIHNDGSPIQRTNELTPESIGRFEFPPDMPEEARAMIVPQGESFDEFVVNTVMPEVEARFPVKKGRENTAFCGSSSGGLQCFFTALSHPDIFSAAGVFSPCFMLYNGADFMGWIHGRLREEMPFLYLYSGGDEGLESVICSVTQMTSKALEESYPKGMLKTVIKPEAKHCEAAWEKIFVDFLHDFLALN
ncbi:alpha/beta hydrolase [Ruminococcus sp.]|uniref:alpha/beta hydrolase n=1 Tax=Ruminococcus sp. TaxID=41978 RepID=UPI002E782F1F|nr:alpha/beta hydrolase-fold protein [Ruminococcus sp.]MEE1263353.1 alpha/beta hydrolase-fold protein [Ruminococcus sp.]